jgi:hypothetical protein
MWIRMWVTMWIRIRVMMWVRRIWITKIGMVIVRM